MGKPTLLVLAAGMGSRFGGDKQVISVGPSGQFLMEYSVFDALKAGLNKIIFILKNKVTSFNTNFS